MFSFSEFQHHTTRKYWAFEAPKSEDYQVFVNGTEVPVYGCRISKYPFNRPFPGYQRSTDQAEDASYVNLVSDEPLTVEIVTSLSFDRVLLKPFSHGITPTVDGQKISFTLDNNGQFVLECGSYHHCLYIFNNKPIPAPDPADVTHYFGPGIHFPGKITLHSNESLYVDKDALVYGCIYADHADHIHIFGNGVLDDGCEGRVSSPCYEEYTNGNMKFYHCNDLQIEGVLMKDSAIWCVNLFHCFRVCVDDVKIFGQWRYNTDGIDVVNSQDVVIRNSFIHSFDDTISLKGIPTHYDTDVANILTENCILWCDWGKCCEVGIETVCQKYRNITFRNCDVLRGGNSVLDIANGICADIGDVVFEDIRADFNAFDTREVFQHSDEQVYDPGDDLWVPALVNFFTTYWHIDNYPDVPEELDFSGVRQHSVHDVTVRNIHVNYDPLLPQPNGRPQIAVIIRAMHPDNPISNIHISDLYVNGKKLTGEDILLTAENVTDLTLA